MYDIGYIKIWSALQVQPQVCFFFIGVHYQFDSCSFLLHFSQYKQLNKKIMFLVYIYKRDWLSEVA